MVCQRAVTLIVDLCLHNSTLLDQDTCQDYLFLLSSQSSDRKEPGKDCNQLLCALSPCSVFPQNLIVHMVLLIFFLLFAACTVTDGYSDLSFD